MLPNAVYQSIHPEYANQTLLWCQGDTEEMYNYNLKNDYYRLLKNGWVDRTIEYKFNSLGFRCDDFDDQPCIVFLGCSRTFGTGLPIENTFSYIVSKHLNLKCINLGLGGSSNDTAYRLGSHYIPKLNAKVVVMNCPPSSRLEIITNDSKFHFVTPRSVFPQEVFYNAWVSGEANMYLNMQKNIAALNFICNQRNIKFVSVNSDNMMIPINPDSSRDLLHPGVRCNQIYAEKILKVI